MCRTLAPAVRSRVLGVAFDRSLGLIFHIQYIVQALVVLLPNSLIHLFLIQAHHHHPSWTTAVASTLLCTLLLWPLPIRSLLHHTYFSGNYSPYYVLLTFPNKSDMVNSQCKTLQWLLIVLTMGLSFAWRHWPFSCWNALWLLKLRIFAKLPLLSGMLAHCPLHPFSWPQ